MESDYKSYEYNTEVETIKILGPTLLIASDTESSFQRTQVSSNLAMYLSNSSHQEMSMSYAQNSNISEQMSDTRTQITGIQRKIVKSNNHFNMSSSSSSPVKNSVTTNVSDEIAEKRREAFRRSNSSSSIDFYVEGEKMVSQLCNITSESPIVEISKATNSKIIVEQSCSSCTCHRNNPIKESNLKDSTTRTDTAIYDETVPLQIIQLAVEACTVAENIAIANKNRPCFKNIQTICEKTRSNVQKPDSAVANLHSQGVPWVIKNFIFSFVRILDGWKGIKELLCEKHESFKRIENKYYNPQIRESFIEWQVATKNMLDHIYKTFKSLDIGFQAEQQRYKLNAAGINYLSSQNPKQVIKHVASVPVLTTNNQLNFVPRNNQWGNNTFTNQSLNQNIPSCGNMYPQWNTQSSNPCIQSTVTTSITRNEVHEASKRSVGNMTEGQDSIEDLKKANNLTYTQNVGTSIHQPNKEYLIKYQPLVSGKTSGRCEDIPTMMNKNQTLKNTTLTDSSSAAYGEMGSSFSIQNIHWSNKNSSTENKIPFGFEVSPGYDDLNFFSTNNPNMYVQNPNTFTNCVSSTCNFESDSEANDGTKIYMKPGSYNIPTKQILSLDESDAAPLETMTVHNSIITKGSIPRVLNLPFSKTSMTTIPPSLYDSNPYNILKRTQSVEKINNIFSPVNTPNYANVGYENSLSCTDKDWEAAKQSAPKLLTNIHKPTIGSKSDTQRLYEALETGQPNEKQSTDIQNNDYVSAVSWNKVSEEFFGGNFQSEKNNLLNEVNSRNTTNSVQMESNLKSQCESVTCGNQSKTICENFTQTTDQVETQVDKNSHVSVTEETTIIEREYGSCDTIKKLKKKNSTANKYSGRRKNEFVASGIKKMENILVTLWNMDKKVVLDMTKAPNFLEITKNPITFTFISDRIKSSFYTDVHQVAHDIRTVFYNAYEYLKIYPDEKRRSQVDEMCTYFEKYFTEEVLNVNIYRDKNRKQKKRSDFYEDKQVNNLYSHESKKITDNDE